MDLLPVCEAGRLCLPDREMPMPRAKKASNPYADAPHVKVRFEVYDEEPPTPQGSGDALIPVPLVEKHGLRDSFLYVTGWHPRYITRRHEGLFDAKGNEYEEPAAPPGPR